MRGRPPKPSIAAERIKQGNLKGLKPAAQPQADFKARGPQNALKQSQLASKSAEEKQQWIEESRVYAILGSAPRTLPSILSGIRAYVAFIGKEPNAA